MIINKLFIYFLLTLNSILFAGEQTNRFGQQLTKAEFNILLEYVKQGTNLTSLSVHFPHLIQLLTANETNALNALHLNLKNNNVQFSQQLNQQNSNNYNPTTTVNSAVVKFSQNQQLQQPPIIGQSFHNDSTAPVITFQRPPVIRQSYNSSSITNQSETARTLPLQDTKKISEFHNQKNNQSIPAKTYEDYSLQAIANNIVDEK